LNEIIPKVYEKLILRSLASMHLTVLRELLPVRLNDWLAGGSVATDAVLLRCRCLPFLQPSVLILTSKVSFYCCTTCYEKKH